MVAVDVSVSLAKVALDLNFTPSGQWGEAGQTYSSLWIGDGLELFLVDGSEVYMSHSGIIRHLPGVRTGEDLLQLVALLSTVDVMQVGDGVFDIAPEREEVDNV